MKIIGAIFKNAPTTKNIQNIKIFYFLILTKPAQKDRIVSAKTADNNLLQDLKTESAKTKANEPDSSVSAYADS
ncbi:MAG: hypothetical protein JW803_04040 [Endomicrobiales bacterium]|nr:hypothetical protein [Endomicrobiales bacterium]